MNTIYQAPGIQTDEISREEWIFENYAEITHAWGRRKGQEEVRPNEVSFDVNINAWINIHWRRSFLREGTKAASTTTTTTNEGERKENNGRKGYNKEFL